MPRAAKTAGTKAPAAKRTGAAGAKAKVAKRTAAGAKAKGAGRTAAETKAPARPRFDERFADMIRDVAATQPNEETIRFRLRELFKVMGRYAHLGHKVGGGEADVVVSEANVVIECKASGKADPNRLGSTRKGEKKTKQREQLFRYMAGLREQVRAGLDFDGSAERPWLGILTDGRKWWSWKWLPGRPAPEEPPEHFEVEEGGERDAFNHLANLLFEPEREGKPWAPDDLASLFRGKEQELWDIYEAAETSEGAIKFQMWRDMLRASGMEPPTEMGQYRLFLQHCYLTAVSKAVIHSLAPERPREELDQSIRERFQSDFTAWLPDARGGLEWLREIFTRAQEFDWRLKATDVLRNFYQAVIAEKDRQAYGEYYTPDWLAEMLAEEILDDEWVETAARAALAVERSRRKGLDGIGVLDPACGSGTFLFHAARRIGQARAFAKSDKQEVANCVARLVHGIDVHPVAVEMARATLLRALPAMPRDGMRALNIHQGDSLLAGGTQGFLRNIDFPSMGKTRFSLPASLFLRDDFRPRVYDFVEGARTGADAKRVLPKVVSGLSEEDKQSVERAYGDLTETCKQVGNSVWFWLVVNSVAPHRLAEKRVDRILANPPWVRMSNIYVEERKQSMRKMAEDLQLWVGGRNATGFDIAALFVLRCRSLYLTGGEKESPAKRLPDTAAAWVTNSGSIAAGNWDEFQKGYGKKTATRILDLREVRKAPFTGAHSCVWLEGTARRAPKMRRLKNRKGAEVVLRTDSWPEVAKKTEWDDTQLASQKVAPAAPSGYMDGQGFPFRQGATFVPHCLILTRSHEEAGRGRVKVRTTESRQPRWRNVKSQEGVFPTRWLVAAAMPDDVFPFRVRAKGSKIIVPLDAGGGLETESERGNEKAWGEAERVYSQKRSRGTASPKTLLERLNFHGALSAQLPLRTDGGSAVLYNGSGTWLRAALCPPGVLVESSFYWYRAQHRGEAEYLVAVLNADCMQPAFRATRKSDRDFHTHFWKKIPIPRYDGKDALHKEIAALCRRAEKVAEATLRRDGLSGSSQVKVSRVIREALREDGAAGEIDAAVRRLLPDHAAGR